MEPDTPPPEPDLSTTEIAMDEMVVDQEDVLATFDVDGPSDAEARSSHRVEASKSAGRKKAKMVQHTTRENAAMMQFEALDYDMVESDLAIFEEGLRTKSDVRWNSCLTWTFFFLIGIATGATAFVIDISVDTIQTIRFEATETLLNKGTLDSTDDDQPALACLFDVCLCAGLVFLAAGLCIWVEPASAGSGIPDMKGYLNGTNIKDALTFNALVCKVLGLICAVGGGLCVGKEGPLVHTGSVIAANISHGFDRLFNIGSGKALAAKNGTNGQSLIEGPTTADGKPRGGKFCPNLAMQWRRFRSDAAKRDFVSGGCAAGIAAAFGAPMGGVLFALEEASSYWSLPLTWKAFFCAMTSTFMLDFLLAVYDGDADQINRPGVFGQFNPDPYRLWELPYFFLLAVAGGLCGAAFNGLNARINRWRRDRNWSRWNEQGEVVGVAVLSAIVFFMLPMLFVADCQPIPNATINSKFMSKELFEQYQCPEEQFNSMATMTFTSQEKTIKALFHHHQDAGDVTYMFDMTHCVVYLVVYWLLSVYTYGLKVPSGLFIPCVIVGAVFGRIVGEWVRIHHGCHESTCVVRPGTYAFIGATAMLGGTTRMTMSLAVILLETTNEIQYLLPIMLTLVVSKGLGDYFNRSLYDIHVELKCIPFTEANPPVGMEQLQAGDIMQPAVCFEEVESLERIHSVLSRTEHNGFPVLLRGTKKYVGIILRSQLMALLNLKAFCDTADGHTGPMGWIGSTHLTNDALSSTSLQSEVGQVQLVTSYSTRPGSTYLDLRSVMHRRPLCIGKETPLTRIYRLWRAVGLRHLPIINIDNEVVGILCRKDLYLTKTRSQNQPQDTEY